MKQHMMTPRMKLAIVSVCALLLAGITSAPNAAPILKKKQADVQALPVADVEKCNDELSKLRQRLFDTEETLELRNQEIDRLKHDRARLKEGLMRMLADIESLQMKLRKNP